MKRFIRFVSLIIAITFICSIPVCAEENLTERASTFFVGHDAYLYKTSDTKFQVWFEVDALRIMDKLGTSEIKVQRSSDGENWTTMFTYKKAYYSQMTCDDTSSHTGYVPYTGTAGYYYRAKVTFYAKDSSGTGEYTMNTAKIKL